MTYPTFSTGEVLTSAAMNAVGLWLIKTQTIGAGVSTIPVTSAFSTDYLNYRIVVNNTSVSAVGNSAYIKFSGSTGSTYSSNGIYMIPTSNTVNGLGLNQIADGIWLGITGGTFSFSIDVMGPFLSGATNVVGQSAGSGNTNYYNTFMGADSNAASSTGFTLVQATHNWTGGTISVYGYQKG